MTAMLSTFWTAANERHVGMSAMSYIRFGQICTNERLAGVMAMSFEYLLWFGQTQTKGRRQIHSILNQIVGPKFLGVFPSDQLPGKVNGPCSFVVNTQIHQQNLEVIGLLYSLRWMEMPKILTAMDLNESNVESILSFLARYSRIGWNTVPIQGPFSSVCGHYCIYFVIQRCNNRSMHEIIKPFFHQ